MLSDKEVNRVEEAFDVDRLIEYWSFIFERHEVFHRRLQGQPRPWTTDPVIDKFFFTNVFRELDIGTVYLLNNIINKGTEVEELLEILIYRQFNNRYTYEAMREAGRTFGDFEDWQDIAEFLKSYQAEKGCAVFAVAHMTTSIKWGNTGSKIGNACWLLNKHWQNRDEIYSNLITAVNLPDLCQRIARLEGFGDFLAYEVATDMGYSSRLKRFNEDDWANPGPGCKRGIEILVPKRAELGIDFQSVMRTLRQNQEKYFNDLGLDFKYPKNKLLSLRNIEHCLCEYSKYYQAKTTGRTRRKYHPEGNYL